jgi:hypothetical protein
MIKVQDKYSLEDFDNLAGELRELKNTSNLQEKEDIKHCLDHILNIMWTKIE